MTTSAFYLYGDYSVILTGLAEFDLNGYLEVLNFEELNNQYEPSTEIFTSTGTTSESLFADTIDYLSSNDMTIGHDVKVGDGGNVITYYVINTSTGYEPAVDPSWSTDHWRSTTSYSSAEIEGLRSKFGFLSGSNYLMMQSSSIDSIVGLMNEDRVTNPYYARILSDKLEIQDITSFRQVEQAQTSSMATGSYTGSYSTAILGMPGNGGY